MKAPSTVSDTKQTVRFAVTTNSGIDNNAFINFLVAKS